MLTHLHSSFFIEREIKQKSQSNLKQELVVAWDKAVELFDNTLLFHLSLIVSENGELL